MEPLLLLEGVSHRYRATDRQALTDINLRVDAGEFVAITGPSGSGKSTLLNILGLLERGSGTYRIAGADVAEMRESDRDRLRSRMFGFVFQSANVIGDDSVRGNVELGLSIQGIPVGERGGPVDDALAAVGLTAIATQRARLLSGGERQRLAVARALVTEPAVVFADEPTGSLDTENGARVMELLEELHRRGHAVVLVTHDEALAARAERRISMLDGRIVADSGTADKSTTMSLPSGDATGMSPIDVLHGAIGALTGSPQRAIILLLALLIGIAGLVTARGVADSAASQVSTRLTAAARDSVSISVPSTARLWTPDGSELGRMQEAVARLDHIEEVAWSGLVAPSEVTITRFRATDPEPYQALSLTAASPELFAFLEADASSVRMAELLTDPAVGEVAVLTPMSAEALGVHRGTDYTGITIFVEGRQTPVVGVIEMGNPELASTFANTVFVSRPAMARLSPSSIDVRYYARTEPGYPSTVAPAVPLAIAPQDPGTVRVQTVADMLGLRVGVAEDLSIFMLALASVVLVLAIVGGGVGTYVSVMARTSEIALMRSLGASRAAVFWLFLVQSLIIGMLGGAAGAVVGQGATLALTRYLGWQPVLSSWAGPAGVLIGTLCGLVAGVVPAVIASRRSPAQAIRE